MLDVGGGSARVGELMLDAGAARYVDVDLSDTMLDLARGRLERFQDKVEPSRATLLSAPLEGPFDIVLALGYFDYIEDAPAHIRRISELCARTAVASFPRWTWTERPIRKVPLQGDQPLPDLDYTESQLRELFTDFDRVEIEPGRSGFLLRADR